MGRLAADSVASSMQRMHGHTYEDGGGGSGGAGDMRRVCGVRGVRGVRQRRGGGARGGRVPLVAADLALAARRAVCDQHTSHTT